MVKEHIVDPYIATKARHMLRRHSVEYVSNYLGMCEKQLRVIKKNMPSGVTRGRPPKQVTA